MRSTDAWLLRRVEVEGEELDCRLRDGAVAELGPALPYGGERVLDAAGGALLPGLADHHLHLFALAAAPESVDLGGSPDLDAAPDAEGAWLRVVGAGRELRRADLDRRWPDAPVRVQHRSGALWTLNSAAVALLADGLSLEERESGQLWRADERLGELLARAGARGPLDLAALGRDLARHGITHVTDASPALTADDLAALETALPQHLLSLAGPGAGPRKIVLADHGDHDLDGLVARIERSHGAGRPVAIHTVTDVTLALCLAAFAAVGAVPGDRLEHVAVCDDGAAARIAALGLTVVTQPTVFARHREAFLAEAPPGEHTDLWRYRGLLDAGIAVAASSDAPYGDADPGATIRAAATRGTESVAPATVLASMLADPLDPGGPPRRVAFGKPADLCLLDRPLDEALDAAAESGRWRPAATFVAGVLAHRAGAVSHSTK
jgi:predicted amidohydrolase YtcJ